MPSVRNLSSFARLSATSWDSVGSSFTTRSLLGGLTENDEREMGNQRDVLSPLWTLLRCLQCGRPLSLSEATEPGYPELGPDAALSCQGCSARYPVVAGTARMLPKGMLDRLAEDYPRSESIRIAAGDPRRGTSPSELKQRTADTFAYTWRHFGPPTEPGF